MCFLPCVSFLGCQEDTRWVSSGHQGGVNTTGRVGVHTTPGGVAIRHQEGWRYDTRDAVPTSRSDGPGNILESGKSRQ
jgi:hypothetical protein